jgi:glc operon protein GlcG
MVLRPAVSGSASVQDFSTTGARHQRCVETRTFLPQTNPGHDRQNRGVKLIQAQAIVDFVVREAPGAVSVYVADLHGEIVAAATMDGAAPDTRLNAQRKAYTAARSDARATSELAAKVADDPVERASFDPFFTFFKGGVAAFDGDARVGAVGVSGLPGEVDEDLARRAIESAGLSTG